MTRRTNGGRLGQRSPSTTTPTSRPVPVRQQPAAWPTTPPAGVTYPQLLRGSSFSPVRSLVGVALGVGLFLLITPVITQTAVMLGWALTSPRPTFADYYTSALRFEQPIGMLGANLGLAALIPISAALMLLMHRRRPSWLISVNATTRWRYAAGCLVVALVVLGGVLTVSVVAGPGASLRPQGDWWVFLIIIVVTSPLQAAAEEIFFRGYLSQALGSLVAHPWFGVVVSSLVFAAFHGGQNLPLFLDRLAFGLLAGLLVLKTGGLEASIAAHVVNNILAYGTAALTGTIAQIRGTNDIKRRPRHRRLRPLRRRRLAGRTSHEHRPHQR